MHLAIETTQIHENCIKINTFAMSGTNKRQVALPPRMFSYCQSSFRDFKGNEVVLAPSSSIPSECFMYASNLQSIIIPNGVISIHSNAFEGTRLAFISLPPSLEFIDNSAFTTCIVGCILGCPKELLEKLEEQLIISMGFKGGNLRMCFDGRRMNCPTNRRHIHHISKLLSMMIIPLFFINLQKSGDIIN